jgi:hypothetical protein
MKRLALFLTAIILLCTISCKDSGVNNRTQSLGNIVLETEFTNAAWGISWFGSYVGENGNVYTYDLAKSNFPMVVHHDGYYTEEELSSKYHHCDTLRKIIPHDTILWCHQRANLVNASSYSDTSRIGADMGALTYSLFLYDSEKMKYRKIVLSVERDSYFYNTSESAIELIKWFKRK